MDLKEAGLKENRMQGSVDSQLSQHSRGSPSPLSPNQRLNIPSLSLEQQQSLALSVRPSIERGLPIPRHMLSHSDDLLQEQSSPHSEAVGCQRVKIEHTEEEKQWLEEQLGLREVLQLRKGPSNTKNVLRNFGNAQNQYILYHQHALEYSEEQLAQPQKFRRWVRGLKLEKFEDFKEVWSSESVNLVFRRVYRELCFRFYQECAIPYVLSSRMKNEATKLSHLRYVYRFLQGIKDPYQFTYFKKLDR